MSSQTEQKAVEQKTENYYCASTHCYTPTEEYQLLCDVCSKQVANANYGDRFISPYYTTAEQRETYARDGHISFEALLNPQQLEEWRKVMDEAVAMRGTNWILPRKDQTEFAKPSAIPPEYYQATFTQRTNLRNTHLGMRQLTHGMKHTLGRIAAELLGVRAVRFYDDNALIKEPYASPTNLHYDGPAWSHDSLAVSAWIALDDATVQNGAMYMIKGSNHVVYKQWQANGNKFTRRAPDPTVQRKMNDVWKRVPDAKHLPICPITLKAGSVSFHSSLTIHGAGPNMSHGRRRAMVFSFFPDGSLFNGHNDIWTDEQMQRWKTGEPLNDEAEFPLAYSAE